MFNAMAAFRLPPLVWSMAEPFRATAELWQCTLSSYLSPAVVGDNQPVLVVPGFTADDGATAFLRSYLRRAGFDAHGWGLGCNFGGSPTGETTDLLIARIHDLHVSTGQKVSLVGWSMGGLIARSVACTHPHLVRQVIALGCPFRGSMGGSAVTAGDALPVPYTAIYSRTDGVVHWKDCIPAGKGQTEHIEVNGSHWGLVTSIDVQRVISDRLAQDEDEWVPFGAKVL